MVTDNYTVIASGTLPVLKPRVLISRRT